MNTARKKKNDWLLSEYDRTFLFNLYRLMRLNARRQIVFKGSTESCLAHLKTLTLTGDKYEIDIQDHKHPLAFRVNVLSFTRNGYSSSTVVTGVVIQTPGNEQESLMLMQAYPGQAFLLDVSILLFMFFLSITSLLYHQREILLLSCFYLVGLLILSAICIGIPLKIRNNGFDR